MAQPGVSDSGFTCAFDEPKVWEGFHRHFDAELNFVVRGGLTLLHGGNLVRLKPDRLILFWAAQPHQNIEVEPGSLFYYVHVPLEWFLQWHLPAGFVDRLLDGGIYLERDGASSAFDRLQFPRWSEGLGHNHPDMPRIVLLEMEARVRRMAVEAEANGRVELVQRNAGALRGGHGDSLVAVVQYVAEHYREPIGAHDIARAVGRHPNYVSTLFRQKGGYRLMDYVNRLRVCHAQQLLMTTEMTILDIALDSGFGSLSRFYRVFKETCGATPRLYRRLHLPPGLRQKAPASA